jgi:hypothetical protein
MPGPTPSGFDGSGCLIVLAACLVMALIALAVTL